MTVFAVSRAPRPEFEAFKERMGSRFKWVSSYGSDFNYVYHCVGLKIQVFLKKQRRAKARGRDPGRDESLKLARESART